MTGDGYSGGRGESAGVRVTSRVAWAPAGGLLTGESVAVWSEICTRRGRLGEGLPWDLCPGLSTPPPQTRRWATRVVTPLHHASPAPGAKPGGRRLRLLGSAAWSVAGWSCWTACRLPGQ